MNKDDIIEHINELEEQLCDKSPDDTHCRCWWDIGTCCYCGAISVEEDGYVKSGNETSHARRNLD